MARPKFTLDCVADRHAAKTRERIAEFIDPATGLGGLISLRRQDDNTLRLDVYRLDDGVSVGVDLAAVASPDVPVAALAAWWRGMDDDERARTGIVPINRQVRVTESIGDPGKWQAQYFDPALELWCDIGDAESERQAAETKAGAYQKGEF